MQKVEISPAFCCRIYVNKFFQTFPESSNLKCKETIRPGVFYKFVVTRSAGGELSLYLNGYPCQTGAFDNKF